MIIEIIILFCLFIVNGLFVMTEIAMVSSRRTKLEMDARAGHKGAKAALEQLDKPAGVLSTVQIAVTLIGILTGVFSSSEISVGLASLLSSAGMSQPTANTLALVIVVTIVTLVAMLIGELVPKRIGLINPEGVTKVMVPPAVVLSKILIPVTWLLTRLSDYILKVLRITPSADSRVTEEEIRALVMQGTLGGDVQHIEQLLVERVFNLGDQKITSLMTHHSELVWLDVTETNPESWDKIRVRMHSVYPVCRDNINNVVGVVYLKEVFMGYQRDVMQKLEDYIRPAQLILDSMTVYETLELFREKKTHYGLVVDEYGSIAGMVVLNDILEAIIGEFDRGESLIPQIHQRTDGSWLADGQVSFYEFAYKFNLQGFDKQKVKFNTLAGLTISMMKHFPKPGEKFIFMGYELEVVDLDGNRVDKLIIKKL